MKTIAAGYFTIFETFLLMYFQAVTKFLGSGHVFQM